MGEITRHEFDQTVKRLEAEDKRQNERIKVLEENTRQVTELTISVKSMATNMEQMIQEQKSQGERLKNLELVPSKNWATFKNGIITAIASAIGGGILTIIIQTLIK